MEVRDPIHGAIAVTPTEIGVVDHPFVQRLRNIRQVGFSELPFPGATHSRYSHCLGVMHLAGRAFDSAFRDLELPIEARERFYSLVRVAALCHDLGHAPYSHCTEFAMPPLAELGISWYRADMRSDRRATHEDYTIAILEHSSLAPLIAANNAFTTRHVAALISLDVVVDDDFFVVGDLDYRRVLSQLISSEVDVDRLDYLGRDSYYTGARYGQVDVPWLLSNLVAYPCDGQVSLALDFRAIYAFDDYMIARHHMFLMVYFHHKSVVYEEMLKRYVTSEDCDWSLPADLDAYLSIDDVSLLHHLRGADDPWARRMVEGRPYKRLIEVHGMPEEIDLSDQEAQLIRAGIDTIRAGSTGKLSRYTVFGQKRRKAPQLYVIERISGSPVESVHSLDEASHIFQRYADARRISRLYVSPEDLEPARRVLNMPI